MPLGLCTGKRPPEGHAIQRAKLVTGNREKDLALNRRDHPHPVKRLDGPTPPRGRHRSTALLSVDDLRQGTVVLGMEHRALEDGEVTKVEIGGHSGRRRHEEALFGNCYDIISQIRRHGNSDVWTVLSGRESRRVSIKLKNTNLLSGTLAAGLARDSKIPFWQCVDRLEKCRCWSARSSDAANKAAEWALRMCAFR